MIRFSLLETKGRNTISLSGKEDLIQKILGLPRRTSDILILTYWGAALSEPAAAFPPTLDGVEFFPPGGN